ncbi:class I SAM-dependent methyltransferase [Acidovorax sp. SUPP950]|uniref:class I SAM-dependent methyltransferase n=1 Tax=Acidovorax sp. SUPP950 TaxID=511901 RepID=UPI0023BD74C6|nr:class I SAM-dependent methyltransferase [Acidovorax sp. SUPP950]GKS75293.1 class I SAM-dependent methyltransferase [Acidovorax sp. SUPP950]
MNADFAPDDGRCRCCGATCAQRTVWREVYLGSGQELRRCGLCAAAYLAPDFSEEALARFYAHDYRRLFPMEVPWRSEERFFALRGDRLVANRRLRRISPNLPRGARLFELGSGFGAFLGAAAAVRPDLHLLASEPDMAHRERLLDGARVQFLPQQQVMDEATLDAVVAFHVMEHLPDPRDFLATVARVLVPGGQAWIEVPDVMSDWRSRNYVHPAHLSYFSASLLQRLAQAAGLDVIYCDAYPGGGMLADNLWLHLRRPRHACVSKPLAAATAQEVRLLDRQLNRVSWALRDRMRRVLKQAIVSLFGSGLVGELQRRRNQWRVLQEDCDAIP